MINNKLSENMISFFKKYLEFYKSFLQIETSKFDDLTKGNLSLLDKSVKREEAFILKSRGLEIERNNLLAQTGNPNATFRELIDILNPPYNTQAKKIYDELSLLLLELKEMNVRCNCLTELKLNRSKAELKKIQNNPELKALYNSKAHNKNITTAGFFSKKI